MLILGAAEASLGLHMDHKGATTVVIISINSQGLEDILVFFISLGQRVRVIPMYFICV